jgi:hypothetical protein
MCPRHHLSRRITASRLGALTALRVTAAVLGVVLALMTSKPSLADEGGNSLYLPGLFGSLAAVPGEPGWSAAFVYYAYGGHLNSVEGPSRRACRLLLPAARRRQRSALRPRSVQGARRRRRTADRIPVSGWQYAGLRQSQVLPGVRRREPPAGMEHVAHAFDLAQSAGVGDSRPVALPPSAPQ